MTFVQILSLALLLAALVLSISRRINIGLLTLTAALVLMKASGTDVKTVFAAFPAQLVVLIIGVTLLFAHAERSGAVQWLVEQAVRVTRGNRAVIPWAGFAIGAGMSTIGAFPTAPISLLLPMLALLAKRHRLNYTMLAVVCVLGSNAAGLSPLSPAGALIKTIADSKGITYSPWKLYGVVLALHVVVCAVLLAGDATRSRLRPREVFAMSVGHAGAASRSDGPATPHSAGSSSTHATGGDEARTPAAAAPDDAPYLLASLASLVAFVGLVLAFKFDVGLTALALALLLQVVFRADERQLIAAVPWNVVILLSGLVVYLGMLDTVGTLDSVESSLSSIGSPVLLVFVLCYVTGIISNMESSTLAVLGVMVPVGLGVTSGSSSDAFAVMVAVTMSAAVVVMNPLHIAGALIISNTEESRQHAQFRNLLLLGISLTAVVPGLIALYPVLTGVG
ncbi:MAG: SLC13 family permease [Nocardioides sp.]|uniref:SLC13 family permease n=1 Tax=Nocardioides sp. TaxID=35761 RepID=UPI0039E69B9D